MALRREVHHPVDIVFIKDLHNGFTVADIRPDKGIVFSVLNISEIFQISRVGQLIHINDTDLVIIFLKHVVNVIGSDKSCSACHQVCSHIFFLLRNALPLGRAFLFLDF